MYQIVLTQRREVIYRVFALELAEALELSREIRDANPGFRVRVLKVPPKNQ